MFVHQHAESVVAMWATRLSCRYQRESRQPCLPGAGGSPIKRRHSQCVVPCMLNGPLTLLEGAPVSIFSWVAMRTDMVRVQVPLVSPPRCACTFVQWSSSCERCLRSRPPLPHTHTLFSLFFPLHPSQTAHGSDRQDDPGVQDPDQSHSLTPLQGGINYAEDTGEEANYAETTPTLVCPQALLVGLRGGECPRQASAASPSLKGEEGAAVWANQPKVTVVYLGSNKRRSLVNTSLLNSARSAFFFPSLQTPRQLSQCLFSSV